jgi:hypothetical protein
MNLSEREVEWLNTEILTSIIRPLLGNRTTYLTDLDRIARKLLGNKYHGTYTSDKIPLLTNKIPYCILNVDKSTEGGSHWVAIAKDTNYYIIYDSFGRKTTKLIPSIISTYGNGTVKDVDYDVEQKIEELNCGQRCIAWLLLTELFGVHNSKKL